MTTSSAWLGMLAALAACGTSDGPIELDATSEFARVTFTVEGDREIRVRGSGLVEAWIAGGTFAELSDEQRAAGAPAGWLAPQPVDGELVVTALGDGEVTLSLWARGPVPPAATRARSTTWFEAELLDDPSAVSFAQLMAAIASDGHGGELLDRWFRAFAAGPGAGRATFSQFLAEVATAQGSDPSTWDLAALPFKVTGVHNRHDLAGASDCGELRVSVASTHPTFAPLHLLFIFRQPAMADDVTPDGSVHCRGAARRWTELAGLAPSSFAMTARAYLASALTREHFVMAESVELTISPWQWRQWVPDGNGGLANPLLFQTLDVERVDAPGALRDAFLAAVRDNASAIDAQRWVVPSVFRSAVIEVQPNAKAALPDLSPLGDVLATYPQLPRSLAMIGCPRCHTDDAAFVQTGVDRVPSPFYDRELDARTARIDALARGGWPVALTFGPLQPD